MEHPMGKALKFVVFLAVVSIPAAALDGTLTPGAVAGWAIMLGVLSGPMYLAPRQYAEWTRRCRFPRRLRLRG
jgi:hypothetical protein